MRQSPSFLLLLLLLLLLLSPAASSDSADFCRCPSHRWHLEPLLRLTRLMSQLSHRLDADAAFAAGIAAAALRSAVASGGASVGTSGVKCRAEAKAVNETSRLLGKLVVEFRQRVGNGVGYDADTEKRIVRPVMEILEPMAAGRPTASGRMGERNGETDRVTSGKELMRLLVYRESQGDACMAETLANTSSSSSSSCPPTSPTCLRLFGTKWLTGYGLTHQLMWLLVRQKLGCRPALQGVKSADATFTACKLIGVERARLTRLLTNKAADGMASNWRINLLDLWTEQGLLCEFARAPSTLSQANDRRLVQLLNKFTSCLKPTVAIGRRGRRDAEFKEEDDDSGETNVGVRIGMRRLLHSRTLKRHCDTHMAGLALSYTAMSIRRRMWLSDTDGGSC